MPKGDAGAVASMMAGGMPDLSSLMDILPQLPPEMQQQVFEQISGGMGGPITELPGQGMGAAMQEGPSFADMGGQLDISKLKQFQGSQQDQSITSLGTPTANVMQKAGQSNIDAPGGIPDQDTIGIGRGGANRQLPPGVTQAATGAPTSLLPQGGDQPSQQPQSPVPVSGVLPWAQGLAESAGFPLAGQRKPSFLDQLGKGLKGVGGTDARPQQQAGAGNVGAGISRGGGTGDVKTVGSALAAMRKRRQEEQRQGLMGQILMASLMGNGKGLAG